MDDIDLTSQADQIRDYPALLVPISEQAGDLLVDSRIVAARCDVQHESVIRLLAEHAETITEAFGILRFEIGILNGPGQPPKFALLTEDQATFLITMVKNTAPVIVFKKELVKAFRAAKNALDCKVTAALPTHLETAEMLVASLKKEQMLRLANEKQARQISELEPKAEFYDAGHNAGERFAQSAMDGDREPFSRIGLGALGVPNAERAGIEVDAIDGDGALGKTASGVQRDFKRHAHPLVAIGHLFPVAHNVAFDRGAQGGDLRVGKLGLYFLRRAGDAEPQQWIAFGKLHADRLVDQLRKELDFEQGGIVAGFFPVNRASRAPRNEVCRVSVTDLARVNDPSLTQPLADRIPCVRHSPQRRGRLVAVMGNQPGRNPTDKRLAGSRPFRGFGGGRFFRQLPRLARLRGIIPAQAGCLIFPLAGIIITPAEIPVRGTGVLSNGGHCEKVSHGLTRDKHNKSAEGGIKQDINGRKLQ
jgi:phage regulator Rha-like protein